MTAGKQAVKVAGVGVAACAACCAGPVLAWLGAVGLGTIGGVALFGTIGLLAGVAGLGFVLWRRRRPPCASPCAAAIPVALTATLASTKPAHAEGPVE